METQKIVVVTMEKARQFLKLSDEESNTISRLTIHPHLVGFETSFYEDFALRGILVDRVEPCLVCCTFKVPPRLTDRSGTLANGAIAYLVDEVGGAVVYVEGLPMNVSVDMSISFLSTAKLNDELEITSKVLGRKGGYAGTLVLVKNKATGELIAEGRHSLFDRPIIHRDIKSTNILITDKFRAKVADFGFARLATGDCDATHISTQIKGTTGYLDPEYLKTYQLTEKSDVYSFGVLLVELMTGRNPIEEKRPLKERVTVKWAMQRLKEGDLIFVMDPILRRSPASTTAMESVLQLARRCVGTLRQSRPSMKECAEELWRIRKQLRETSMSSSSASPSYQSADFPKRNARISRKTTFGIEEDENYRFISA